MKKHVHKHKKKASKFKEGARHGAIAGFGSSTVHHIFSDWTVHGILHEILHNGVYAALAAAFILALIDIFTEKGG